jgi:hypothetical protein
MTRRERRVPKLMRFQPSVKGIQSKRIIAGACASIRPASLALCVALIGAAPAWAEGIWTPYAAEAIEHNSDVFDLTKSGPEPVGSNGPSFADTSFDTRAGIDGIYLLDQQKFFATAEFRHFNYENYSLLDHNEVLLDGGLSWKLSHALDGAFEYRHEERMVQFLDLAASTQLTLESDDIATASVNFNVTPEWRVESRARDRVLNSPRTDTPGLSLHEDSIHEELRYLGLSNLSAGVEAEYLEGRYNHDPTALTPDYHQFTLGFASNYLVSGFTSFSGNLGYTRRTDPTNVGLSAVTGAIGYQHSITGKTSMNLQISRNASTYVTTGGNELDTAASLTLTWQASYKIAVKGGYSYTNSKYPQTPDGNVVINRVDHFQIANAEMDYQVLRWFAIRPYVRYQTRHSNDETYTFTGTVVGIEFLAKEPRGPTATVR